MKDLRQQLVDAGYKVTALMQGGYMASKGQRTYKAETIEGLHEQILGSDY